MSGDVAFLRFYFQSMTPFLLHSLSAAGYCPGSIQPRQYPRGFLHTPRLTATSSWVPRTSPFLRHLFGVTLGPGMDPIYRTSSGSVQSCRTCCLQAPGCAPKVPFSPFFMLMYYVSLSIDFYYSLNFIISYRAILTT